MSIQCFNAWAWSEILCVILTECLESSTRTLQVSSFISPSGDTPLSLAECCGHSLDPSCLSPCSRREAEASGLFYASSATSQTPCLWSSSLSSKPPPPYSLSISSRNSLSTSWLCFPTTFCFPSTKFPYHTA